MERINLNKILVVLSLLFFLAAAVVAFGWLTDSHDPIHIENAIGWLGLGGAAFAGAALL